MPVGRGRRFGGDMNPWLNGLLGNWMVNLAGRVQWRDADADQRAARRDDRERAAGGVQVPHRERRTGTTTVYTLPQDIIDNTIRAFSTDPTSATGYGALGAPTGRYIAPASSPDCIAVCTRATAASRNRIYVMTPAFTRFDLSVKKRFPLAAAGRTSSSSSTC